MSALLAYPACMSEELTHIDAQGCAGMVDVSHKKPMHRVAVAEARFVAAAATIDLPEERRDAIEMIVQG